MKKLVADNRKEAAVFCADCEKPTWPAPVQFDKNTRLCEECASKRRHPAKGVKK